MYLSVFYQKATGGMSQTHLLKIVVFPRCLTGWLPLGRSGWPNSRSLRACCPESEFAKVPISCTFVFESAAKSAETCGAGFSEPGGCRGFSWILLLLFFWPETVTSSEVLGFICVVVYTFVVVVVVFGGRFVSDCFSQGHMNSWFCECVLRAALFVICSGDVWDF